MDQKNTLLYRDAEGNSSLDSMVDILQQKGVRENKTKPQINLQARGDCNAQKLEEASPSELSKGPQTQTRGAQRTDQLHQTRGCSQTQVSAKGRP